jgi:hypothetical protein
MYMCVCMCVYECMYVCMCVYVYEYVYTCVYIYIYIYIYTTYHLLVPNVKKIRGLNLPDLPWACSGL